MSDVRDVAKIHVLALENNDAVGKRFVVTSKIPIPVTMAEILKSMAIIVVPNSSKFFGEIM